MIYVQQAMEVELMKKVYRYQFVKQTNKQTNKQAHLTAAHIVP